MKSKKSRSGKETKPAGPPVVRPVEPRKDAGLSRPEPGHPSSERPCY